MVVGLVVGGWLVDGGWVGGGGREPKSCLVRSVGTAVCSQGPGTHTHTHSHTNHSHTNRSHTNHSHTDHSHTNHSHANLGLFLGGAVTLYATKFLDAYAQSLGAKLLQRLG